MNVKICKTALSVALFAAMGGAVSNTAQADAVFSWDLQDYNSDGLKSDFVFTALPPGETVNLTQPTGSGPNVFGDAGEVGCTNATLAPPACDPVFFDAGPQPTLGFTSGFLFAGYPFTPNVTSDDTGNLATGSISAEITIDQVGDRNLTFSALDFAGVFGSTTFLLPPTVDDPSTRVADPSLAYIEDLTDLGNGQFGVVVRWFSLTDPNSPSFASQPANWRVEGQMTVTDGAPTIFLNGTNPAQATPGQPYTDPGAVCMDVVDGAIDVNSAPPASFTTIPADCDRVDAGVGGSSFTCEYLCTDSQGNSATPVIRTVNVGADTTPPVITLGVAPDQTGRNDSPDGTTVDILVDVPYIDAGGTCSDDLDGDIPLGTVGTPGFTVSPDPAVVDTSATGSSAITFSCNDTAGNGPTVAVRTVNVIADNEAPVITLLGSSTVTLQTGEPFVDPGATCLDTNPVDGSSDISDRIDVSPLPSSIDTSVPGTTVLTYTCVDDAGNGATPETRTVNVVDAGSGVSFDIISMTISDVLDSSLNPGTDGLAGCFRFASLDSTTCDGANRFSSDNSVTGLPAGGATIPGSGTDLDNDGNPIGVRFGVFQDVKQITPGFLFTGFPFEPFTFDPPSTTATPPQGVVKLIGAADAILLLDSFPFSGLFTSNQPNAFFLNPDPGTLSAEITQINNDDDGTHAYF